MVKDQRSPRMVSRTKAIPEYALLAPKYSYNLLSSQFKYVHNILSHEFEIKVFKTAAHKRKTFPPNREKQGKSC